MSPETNRIEAGDARDRNADRTRSRARSEAVMFFVATYAIAWTILGSFAVSGGAPTIFGKATLPNWWIALCVCAPSVAGLVLTLARGGPGELRATFARGLQPRSRAWFGWFGIALAIMPFCALLTAFFAATLPSGHRSDLTILFDGKVLLYALLVILSPYGGAGGEDLLGWRAYALPRLVVLCGPRVATLTVSVLWAFWHLPLYVLPHAIAFARPLSGYPGFFLLTLGTGVICAWITLRTGGNFILGGLVVHAMSNATQATTAPGAPDDWLWCRALAVGLVALAVFFFDRKAFNADHRPRAHAGAAPAESDAPVVRAAPG